VRVCKTRYTGSIPVGTSKTETASRIVLSINHEKDPLRGLLRFILTRHGQHEVIPRLSLCSVVRFAEMAELVMHHLAKVDYAGSSPVLRSNASLA
jgi:hypothetical protein